MFISGSVILGSAETAVDSKKSVFGRCVENSHAPNVKIENFQRLIEGVVKYLLGLQ